MNNYTKTLVGIRRFHSDKKGKDYAILLLNIPFTDREISNGCLGLNIEEIFVPEDLMGMIPNLKMNKPIKFDYNVVGKNAYVIGWSQDEK